MKLKIIKNLKTDISGYIGSSFKVCKSLKDVKSNVYFKLNKNLKRRKVKRNSIFKLKNLLNKAKSGINSTSYINLNKNSNFLDFNSANTRNVFLRTKRKSSFGQTLLEKQKLKSYIPYIKENILKKYFNNSSDRNVFEKYRSIFGRMDYVLNSSSVFISKDFIKSKLVLKKDFFNNKIFNFYSFDSNNLKYSFLKLNYSSEKQNSINVFNRVIPNNVLHDIRINKLKVLSDSQSTLPFSFNVKKIIQHYRLKRS